MSKRAVENIKMVIIVVLFFATILLLYLIWGGSKEVKVSDLIPDFDNGNTEINVAEIVVPQNVYYSAGDGSFRYLSDSYSAYLGVMEYFREFSDKSTVLLSEITGEQYKEAIENNPAIIVNFNYELPFSELCSSLNIEGSSAYESVGNINQICFSSAASDSILVFNENRGNYYRLASDSLSLEFAAPGFSETDYNCYPLSSVLGAGGDGLIPLLTQISMPENGFYTENSFSDSEKRTEIAKTIFGDSFNFVRRITDSFGNYTYMYGFGEKTLTLGAGGSIEYKAITDQGSSRGFYEDLKTAKNFADNLRLQGVEEDSKAGLKLKDVKTEGSGKTAIYTFCFVMEYGPYEILGNEKYAMEITVEKGQVCGFKSSIVSIDFASEEKENYEIMDAANVIAANANSAEAFTLIAENYKSMTVAYYMKEGRLIPVWSLSLNDGQEYYYDICTGESIK